MSIGTMGIVLVINMKIEAIIVVLITKIEAETVVVTGIKIVVLGGPVAGDVS